MREIKLEIMFVVHGSDFVKRIEKHYTTVNRILSGRDKLDYKAVEIVAKRMFTGLRDKNGVECYEGDIIKAFKNTYIVKHGAFTDVCVFDSCPDDDDPDLADTYGWYLQNITDEEGFGETLRGLENHCEIIGNVNQHPHLLETTA